MQSDATTVAQYLADIPAERADGFLALRSTIIANLPDGFVEQIHCGMLGYVVPHRLYPAGYHCNPQDPLPFINLGLQKNFFGFYHMGIYADTALKDWFTAEYPKHCTLKLDMGKSCIRFKNPNKIPHALIAMLVAKVSVEDWIQSYENRRQG